MYTRSCIPRFRPTGIPFVVRLPFPLPQVVPLPLGHHMASTLPSWWILLPFQSPASIQQSCRREVGRQARTRMGAILTTKSLLKPKDRVRQTAQNPHPPIWPIRTTPSEKERQAVNAQHRICCSQTWDTENCFQMPPHHACSFVLSLDGRRSFLEWQTKAES